MSFDPLRVMDARWAFSPKKQADYATLVPDASITKSVGVIGSEVIDLSRVKFTDKARYGKGHEFATISRELTRDSKYARTFDCTSLLAAEVAAFGMGKVVTTQPAVGTDPTVYQHVITFSDPASAGKQVPVTTFVEKLPGPAGLLRRLESVAVADFTISGKAREVCQMSVNFQGSGKITTGADSSFPSSLSPVSVLDMGILTFKLGAPTAAADLTGRLSEFTLKVMQNLDVANSKPPGTGPYSSRMWVGDRDVDASWKMWLDSANSDMLDHWNADDPLEVQFNLDGDVITGGSGAYKHSCDIKLPVVRITANKIGASAGLYEYQLSVTKDDVYKDAGGTPNEPLQITIINTEAAFLGT